MDSTETKVFIDHKKVKNYILNSHKKIILGIGSSGPTTKWGYDNFALLINELNKIGEYYFYLLSGPDEEDGAKKIINLVKKNNCESLSSKDVSEIMYYIYLSDIFIGNDSFGHHIACQMNKPCFIILLDTPRAYSDYSQNQYRLTPPDVDINEISHDSALDPNLITAEMIINKIKSFI